MSIDHQLNAHLAQEERADEYREAVNTTAAELVAGDYSPTLPENVGDALGELNSDQLAKIAGDIAAERYGTLGEYLSCYIQVYWWKAAHQKAVNIIDAIAERAARGDYDARD